MQRRCLAGMLSTTTRVGAYVLWLKVYQRESDAARERHVPRLLQRASGGVVFGARGVPCSRPD